MSDHYNSSEQPPAGWFPDPGGSHLRRYWTGTAWGDLEQASGDYTPAGMYPDPEDPSKNRFWDGMAWETKPAGRMGRQSVPSVSGPRPARSRSTLLVGVLVVLLVASVGYAYFHKGSSGNAPATMSASEAAVFCPRLETWSISLNWVGISSNEGTTSPTPAQMRAMRIKLIATAKKDLTDARVTQRSAIAILRVSPVGVISNAFKKSTTIDAQLVPLMVKQLRLDVALAVTPTTSQWAGAGKRYGTTILKDEFSQGEVAAMPGVQAVLHSACPSLVPAVTTTTGVPASETSLAESEALAGANTAQTIYADGEEDLWQAANFPTARPNSATTWPAPDLLIMCS